MSRSIRSAMFRNRPRKPLHWLRWPDSLSSACREGQSGVRSAGQPRGRQPPRTSTEGSRPPPRSPNRIPCLMYLNHWLGVHRRRSQRFVTCSEPVVRHDSPNNHIFEASISRAYQGQQKHWEERGTEERSKECLPEPKMTSV